MTSSTDLYTDIDGRLFKGEAPAGAEFPYVVFSIITDIPEYPGGKIIEKVIVQFSLFSDSSGTTEVEDMLTHLRSLYDDCTLTITSNTLIYFIRENLTTMRDEITTVNGTVGVWNYAQEYSAWMVRT
jgi:hypothetical protein